MTEEQEIRLNAMQIARDLYARGNVNSDLTAPENSVIAAAKKIETFISTGDEPTP